MATDHPSSPATHTWKVSHPEKVIFPKIGLTKADIIAYYRRMADYILPHIKKRLLTLERYPHGAGQPGFYQREIPDSFPAWIGRHTIHDKGGGQTTGVVVSTAEELAYLANYYCLILHMSLGRIDKINNPDRLVFDLDPSADDFSVVRTAALDLRGILTNRGLTSFVQTTGRRGLHVAVPIRRTATFDHTRTFARRVAEELIAVNPTCCTLEQRKQKRGDLVYIDVLRNSFAQSMVTPYTVRATPQASVATPLRWEEVENKSLKPDQYTVKNIILRLKKIGDPWGKMLTLHQAIPKK